MTTSLEPGDVIKGKYTVERVIGEGGMGVVVSAFHDELEAHVAIKVLNEDVMANPQVVERFEREARAAVKIKSRHVARVTDVGKLLGGRPYMVMEYLEGSDLEAVMLKEESLPVVRAVDYVLQACDAIAEAHTLGIVHRDLKPGNLFLAHQADGSKEIKVLDFGISKSTNPKAPDKGLTSATEIFGSAMYMSPEQLTASANVDARADIWSLGVILYELLTGNPPFHEGTVAEIWSGILHKEITKPTKHRPSIPAGLEKAIMKCLARDLDARFQHVADLAEAIAPFGTGDSQTCVDRAVRFRVRAAGGPESSTGLASGSFRAPISALVEPPAPRAPMQSIINVDIDWDDSAAPAQTAASPATSTPKPRPKSMRPPAASPAAVQTKNEKARTTTDWQSVAPPPRSAAPSSRPPPRKFPWPMVAIAGGVAIAVAATIFLLNARTSSKNSAATGTTSPTGPITKPTGDAPTLIDSPADPASPAASGAPGKTPAFVGRLPSGKAKPSAEPSASPSAAPAASAAPSGAPPVDDGGEPAPVDEPTVEPAPTPPPTPAPPPTDPLKGATRQK
jgi:serine/threonine protein kinase